MANRFECNLRKWYSVSVGLLLFAALALLWPGFAKGAGADEIAIGVVLPISGREAKPGQYQREGIDLAAVPFRDRYFGFQKMRSH